jgi:hypothetical protein
MIIYFSVIIFAFLTVLPRGYLLAYVIDRGHNFSFGFKFFAGWVFGIAAFTLDVFSSNALGGFKLAPWIFWFGVLGQIFGLEFVIYLFERKLILPEFKKWRQSAPDFFVRVRAWPGSQKKFFLVVFLLIFVWLSLFAWQTAGQIDAGTTYGQNIFATKAAFWQSNQPFNDALFKTWPAQLVGHFDLFASNFFGVIYFLFLIMVFYQTLPSDLLSWPEKMLSLVMLGFYPWIYSVGNAGQGDILFSIFIFLTFVSFYFYLAGFGSSYFYFAGIAWAFASWNNNFALIVVFPLLVLMTAFLWWRKQRTAFNLFIFWFFAILTISPWLTYIAVNRFNIFFGFAQSIKIVWFWPIFVLFSAFYFKSVFGKINLRLNDLAYGKKM